MRVGSNEQRAISRGWVAFLERSQGGVAGTTAKRPPLEYA
jgi:hypothetical protein